MRENRNHRIVDGSPAAQPGSFMPRSTARIRFSLHNARLAMSALMGPAVTEVVGPTLVALTFE